MQGFYLSGYVPPHPHAELQSLILWPKVKSFTTSLLSIKGNMLLCLESVSVCTSLKWEKNYYIDDDM